MEKLKMQYVQHKTIQNYLKFIFIQIFDNYF